MDGFGCEFLGFSVSIIQYCFPRATSVMCKQSGTPKVYVSLFLIGDGHRGYGLNLFSTLLCFALSATSDANICFPIVLHFLVYPKSI